MSTQSDNRTIDTGTEHLLARVEDGVAVLTLNRPEARNALSPTMLPTLRRLLPELELDRDVGCVLLTGAGKAFCAGGDVKGMSKSEGPAPSPEERIHELRQRQAAVTAGIHELGKPVIAALPGAAAGAGLSIALSCDLRIAAESAFITTAFANIGLAEIMGEAGYSPNSWEQPKHASCISQPGGSVPKSVKNWALLIASFRMMLFKMKPSLGPKRLQLARVSPIAI